MGGQRSVGNSENNGCIDGKWVSEKWHTGSNERNVCCNKTIGSLCRSDFKGVGNQYVADGKCIVQYDE
jgi:hypothetical protein